MNLSRQTIGLWLGISSFTLVLCLPQGDMSAAAQAVAAVTVLMAIWWITEALPLAATALLPMILFPLLGVSTVGDVSADYAHHLVFLFLGGFMIAVTIERWQLHRRLALQTIHAVGYSPARLLFGFMLATAVLSMWISNTATVMMMVPIAAAVAGRVVRTRDEANAGEQTFATALMLGIAYAASIGGIATLIGTPPNAVLAGMIEQLYDTRISFAEWMIFGLPFAAVFLCMTWWYLHRFVMRAVCLDGDDTIIATELAQLGRLSVPEKRVLVVFVLVALAWMSRGLIDSARALGLEDSTIAVAGALLLFLLPAGDEAYPGQRLLDWDTAKKIPWGVLILFGGGFALAGGFVDSGLSEWLGQQLMIFGDVGVLLLVALVVTLVIFMTEVTSNTATATLLIPIMAGFAEAAGLHPFVLMTATAVAASLAFMLPVATPPNAIIFGTPYVSVPRMARAGIWLNLMAIPVLTLFVVWLLPLVWGIPLTR